MSTVKFVFHGTVQGIGFRAHVKKKAMELGIKGWGILIGTGASAWLITNVNAWMNTPTGSFNIAINMWNSSAPVDGS